MIQEKQTKRTKQQKWYRFGVPVGTITVSIPITMKEVIKEEAKKRNTTVSALVTDLMVGKYGKKAGIEQDGGA